MTAHDLFALADSLALGGTQPVFEADNASAELFHLGAGQGVPWHRHLGVDDVFYGLRGHALVRVREDRGIVDHELAPGRLVVVRAGSPHTVTVDSPSAAYLLLQAPGDESDIHYE